MATARKNTQTGLGPARRTSKPPPASGPITVPVPSRRHTTPMETPMAPAMATAPTERPPPEPLVTDEAVKAAQRDSSVKRRSREPLRVDDVGDAAVRIASRAKQKSGVRPRVMVPARVLQTAKLTRREVFIASLLDGHLTIEEIIDSAAMPEEIVQAAIRRLVELKLVKL